MRRTPRSSASTRAAHVRHPVRQREERGDRSDVPDVLVRESVLPQRSEVGVVDRDTVHGHLHRERKHCALALRNVGLAVIDRYLVGHERVLGVDSQDRAVGNDAVEAIVGAGCRDDDHLPLGLRQPTVFLHQRIVIREERAKFVRPVRERDEHVRHEAGFFLHADDPCADVVG